MTERERIADELRRVRDGVRDRALDGAPPATPLPPPLAVQTPGAMPPDAAPPPEATTPRPDNADLNRLWSLRGMVARVFNRILGRLVDRQEAFNSRQVQFDNAILDYIDARIQETHRQYDGVLGIHRRHMGEIDERHLIMQEELVAHVHDLVKRIDLVLGEAERGRLGLEFALRDVRSRLARLEEEIARSSASAAGGVPSGDKRAGGPKDPQLDT